MFWSNCSENKFVISFTGGVDVNLLYIANILPIYAFVEQICCFKISDVLYFINMLF